MSRLNVDAIHTEGSSAGSNLEFTADSRNVTAKGDLQVDGNVTVTGTLPADKLTGTAAAINGSNITNLPAANLTGTLPAISGANLTNLPAGGKGKNLFINGAMAIDQRRAGSAEDFDSGKVWVVDRFFAQEEGTQNRITVQQVDVAADTDPWNAGFRKAGKITNGNQNDGPVAAAGVHLHYKFEAQDIAQSGWDYTSASSYVQLSFWVKSSVAFTLPFYIRSRDGSARMYSSTQALSANTWTKVTKSIPGDTGGLQIDNDNDRGLELLVAPYYGTDGTADGSTLNAWKAWSSSSRFEDVDTTWWDGDDATIEFTGFKLEVGSSVTDFDFESQAETLRKCQRYYQRYGSPKTFKQNGSGGFVDCTVFAMMLPYDGDDCSGGFPLPVEMRESPTLSGTDSNGGGDYIRIQGTSDDFNGGNFFQINNSSPQFAGFHIDTPDGLETDRQAGFYFNSTAGYFDLDAEL